MIIQVFGQGFSQSGTNQRFGQKSQRLREGVEGRKRAMKSDDITSVILDVRGV